MFQAYFACTTSNIILSLLFNGSFGFDEEKQFHFLNRVSRHFKLIVDINQSLPFLPSILSRYLTKMKELTNVRQEFYHNMLSAYLRQKPAPSRDPLVCVSDYLWKIFGEKSEAVPFMEEDIPYFLMDLFMAGQETTTLTLSWCVLNLLHKPEIQEKVYEELLDAFPERDQIITFNELKQCNYTIATIHEAQRFTPTIFSSLDHTATVDIDNLRGYRIPKGTQMYAIFGVINNDTQLWKFPDEFNPENFLDEDGAFQKRHYMTPFSVGLRSCPGESIAKTELYLVFGNLFRRYKICAPQIGTIPPLSPVLGFVLSPRHYKVQLQIREK